VKVCLDTNVFVWGVREVASSGQEEQVGKAKALLAHLEEKGATIIVPSVVVGEILLALPVEQHAMTINLLDQAYIIAPFDIACAGMFAKLWEERKNDGTVEALMGDENATRKMLKADCLIVATAIQHGADVLYSHDGPLRKFANGSLRCEDIPIIEVQQDLFEEIPGTP
jgi:predicted nucleic acid-binding protein